MVVPRKPNLDSARRFPKATLPLEDLPATVPGDAESGSFSLAESDAVGAEMSTEVGKAPTRDPEGRMPERIGPFEVERRLGTGGMGEVFLARDPNLGRRVALKRLRTRRAANEAAKARFVVEARVTAMLQHPSIIPVYTFSEAEGGVFYTMRPVDGISLAELIVQLRRGEVDAQGEWTVAHMIRLFLQAANAVAYAHSRDVVHRDLKPANIMIGPFEEVVILDWGVAKLLGDDTDVGDAAPEDLKLPESLATGTQKLVGTFGYVAPEQLRGVPACIQTDVFALGVTLYELLALKLPWKADTLKELRVAMVERPPSPARLQPRREIPQRLVEVVFRAIERDRRKRYRTVAQFAHDVAHAFEGRATWISADKDEKRPSWYLDEGRLAESRKGKGLSLRSKGRRNSFYYYHGGALAGNIRLSFEMSLPRGKHYLAVCLHAPSSWDGENEHGYRMSVVAGRSRDLALFRNGRDVTGAYVPEYEPKRWYSVVAQRVQNRVSLSIDGDEVYAYTDPIPVTGGSVGILGRSTGLNIRNLEVSSQGVSASVSCLSVPDAFFNRGLYEEARDEYELIATSLAGRREAREAGFRAGLCSIEIARQQSDDAEMHLLLLDEAWEVFSKLLSEQDSCLLPLGQALVAAERRQFPLERESLNSALVDYPDDPQQSVVREWILGRLHSAGAKNRRIAAELIPLALVHCMDGPGSGVVQTLVHEARRDWEMPSFMGCRQQGALTDPVVRAEAMLFFGFWSAQTSAIEDAVAALNREKELTVRHAADAVFALLELGVPERAHRMMQNVRQAAFIESLPPEEADVLSMCDAALLAARGDLDGARRRFARIEPVPGDRVYNSARLSIARSLFAVERCSDAVTVLAPLSSKDYFAHEHRAWLYLKNRDHVRADIELAPLLAKGRHQRGRDLSNFLYGSSLLMQGREKEAMAVFALLPDCDFPRTWTLGSYVAGNRLAKGEDGRYLEKALPWERRHFYLHMALLARARGDDDEFDVCWQLAAEPLADSH